MINQDDWEKVKERYRAFWNNEIIDRAMLSLTCYNGKPIKPLQSDSLEDFWFNHEKKYEHMMSFFAGQNYYGDAFPIYFPNFGPGMISNTVGGNFDLAGDTVWYDLRPIISDLENRPKLQFNESSRIWKVFMNHLNKFLPTARDNYIVAMTDLGGTLDILSGLRGGTEILIDMLENPDGLKEIISELDQAWITGHNTAIRIISEYQEGYSTWLPLWHDKPFSPLQCDVSVMFSTDMFEEFALPSIIRQAQAVGIGIYHIDGFEQQRHLDLLLQIPEIKAFQFAPPNMLKNNRYYDIANEKYFPMYKKIQRAKKGLILCHYDPADTEKLMDVLSPYGLFLHSYVDTPEQAEYYLSKMPALSAKASKNK